MKYDHIFNISAIKSMMVSVPRGQRIYDYFNGDEDAITDEEKMEIKNIITEQAELSVIKLDEELLKEK